jgi:DNA-binding LytR/AlgR family response regulator
MINCIAVDDEKHVLDFLVDNIKQVPYLHLSGACKNAIQALEALQQSTIDLIFLDIQMPKLNGLEFIQTLKNPPMVILVTAYDKYALESYNLNVVDYLLKPISFERFLKACNKAKAIFDLTNGIEKPPEASHLFVNVAYTLVKIPFNDIIYIEGLKDYIKIYLGSAEKPIITKMSLKSIEEKLAGHRFLRVHKSFIIAVDKITVIKRDYVYMNDHEIPVSNVYKEQLLQLINH